MISTVGLIRSVWVGLRLGRRKISPWMALAIAVFHLIANPDGNQTQAKIRWMLALSRVDLVGFCELLQDLCW